MDTVGGRRSSENAELSQQLIEADATEEPYDFPLPALVLAKVFERLPVSCILNVRLVCANWNESILWTQLLDRKSCFVFDGRKEDSAESPKCAQYMESCGTQNSLWGTLRLRRIFGRHTNWLFHTIDTSPSFASNVSSLELLNSTLNWATILQLLLQFPNLSTFVDRQDIYSWDFATFNSGLEEDQTIVDSTAYAQLPNREKLSNLGNLRVVRIHRSQLMECSTYLKLLTLVPLPFLRELEITTDQNFAPQRGLLFYAHLEGLLRSTELTLRVLKFPYKVVTPCYDFRATDEHRLFREFLNFITEAEWSRNLNLPALRELGITFGIVPVEQPEFVGKLLPFLNSLRGLRKFSLGVVHLERGSESVVQELVEGVGLLGAKVRLGLFMNDAAAGVPELGALLKESCGCLSVQTFRDFGRELSGVVPGLGGAQWEGVNELQYFAKNHTFRNFNLGDVISTFRNLTQLNLVDHNARLETRHSCEALATIEDDDIQLLIRRLTALTSLQLIGNMTFVTDSGLTGLAPESTKAIIKSGNFVLGEDQKSQIGLPFSHLQNLRSLVLRGLGIKVTDVSAKFGFNWMPFLTKLHLYGCHQISGEGRSGLSQMYNVTRGCDLQV